MQACLVIMHYVEECTTYGSDVLRDPRRRQLQALFDMLGTTLPFLQQVLSHSYSAASEAAASGGMQDAKAHAEAVKAALGMMVFLLQIYSCRL